MISKQEAKEVVNKYAPILMKSLGMTKYKINFHVLRSTSKEFKNLKFKSKYDDASGWSYSAPKSADVIIFIDKHARISTLVSTLFHELLHVRIFTLSTLVTIYTTKAFREEEKLVRDLERVFSQRKKLRF